MDRYSRHLLLEEFGGEAGQTALSNAAVAVVGMGGLGCSALPFLVSAGVGSITLIDGDEIAVSNLQRQILFTEDKIGHSKVEVAAEAMSALNSTIEIFTHCVHLSPENSMDLLSGTDLVLDCTDNVPVRYLINDTCLLLNIPWVFAALYKFEGQVSVFNYRSGPTYRCLFPYTAEMAELPTCSSVGVFAPLVGTLGSLQAGEALKVLLDMDALSGKVLCYNVKNHQQNVFSFRQNRHQVQHALNLPYPAADVEYSFIHHKIDKQRSNLSPYLIDIETTKDLGSYRWIDLREPHETPKIQHPWVMSIPFSQAQTDPTFWTSLTPCVLFCASGQRARMLASKLQLSHVYFVDLEAKKINSLLNRHEQTH